jgi:phage FluMu protein Com
MAKVPMYDLRCKKCGHVQRDGTHLRYVKYIQGRCPRCKHIHAHPWRRQESNSIFAQAASYYPPGSPVGVSRVSDPDTAPSIWIRGNR